MIRALAIFAAAALAGNAGATEVRKFDDTTAASLGLAADDYGSSARFDPVDPTLVGLVSDKGVIELFDLNAMTPQWKVASQNIFDAGFSFSHDGRVIAAGDGDSVVIHDVYTGNKLQSFKPTLSGLPVDFPLGTPSQVRFSKDDLSLLFVTTQGLILADRATGQTIQEFHPSPEDSAIWYDGADLQFSSDERFVFFQTKGYLYVFLVTTGEIQRRVDLLKALNLSNGSGIENVKVTADGAFTAVVTGFFVSIVDNATEQVVRRTLASAGKIDDIAITEDQCCFMTASWDGTSRLYDIATGEQITRLDDTRPSNQRVGLKAVSSRAKLDVIVSTDWTGVIRVWKP